MLCDIVVLNCMKKKYYYREKKYKCVEDDELVSINEGRVKAELLPPRLHRDSETGCRKSTSNGDFEPQC